MKKNLTIGIIQPVINPDLAWNKKAPFLLNVDSISAERVWSEIKAGLIEMLRVEIKPDIILIPELHLPISKVATIRKLSKKHGVIIISGIDFQSHPVNKNKIRNRGIICIPDQVNNSSRALKLVAMQFGKTYFTYMEREAFKDIEHLGECFADPEPNMYIFESTYLGNFGIMICSDIFDIERMSLYQGRIHHLFIIALNKDLNTYFSMAESLTRLLYCNVVICNTGFYGGSIAMSPYRQPHDRTIYKYIGQRMFNTQVIEVPLEALDQVQKLDFVEKQDSIFKAPPPGYPTRS